MLETLKSLLEDPSTTTNTIISALASLKAQLKKNQELSFVLNQKISGETVLDTAIKSASLDVIQLLLDSDCLVTPYSRTLLDQRLDQASRDELESLLDFYMYLQNELLRDPEFSLGKVLQLGNASMDHLSEFYQHESCVVLLGASGVGKSTLMNIMAGCSYENDKSTRRPKLLLSDASKSEHTKTSSASISETTYPVILPLESPSENTCLVDMPGCNDNRSLAHKVVAGISAINLANCFHSVRMMAIVIEDSDFMNPRNQRLQESLIMAAKIIKSELLSNLVLIVNKVPSHADATKEDTLELLKDIIEALPADSKYILESITADQLMLVHDVPDQEQLRKDFYTILANKKPINFSEYDFSHYNTQMHLFKRILLQLRYYQVKVTDEIKKLTDNMILSEQIAKLEAQRQQLTEAGFDPFELNADFPSELLSEAEQLNVSQKSNESLRREMITIYDLLINELRQMMQMCDCTLNVAQFKKQMVDDIMNKLNPVMQIMKSKYDTPKVTASVSGLFQQAQSEPDSADVENWVMLDGPQ